MVRFGEFFAVLDCKLSYCSAAVSSAIMLVFSLPCEWEKT